MSPIPYLNPLLTWVVVLIIMPKHTSMSSSDAIPISVGATTCAQYTTVPLICSSVAFSGGTSFMASPSIFLMYFPILKTFPSEVPLSPNSTPVPLEPLLRVSAFHNWKYYLSPHNGEKNNNHNRTRTMSSTNTIKQQFTKINNKSNINSTYNRQNSNLGQIDFTLEAG